MKRLVLIFSIVVLTWAIYAQASAKYLVKIDRKAAYEHFQANEMSQLILKLPSAINIYYTSSNYLLAGLDESGLKAMPNSLYSRLDSFPLTGNWYLLTKLPERANLVTKSMGEMITQMDQTILLKSNLSDAELARVTEIPYVELDFTPLTISTARMMQPVSNTRVDFGQLLSLVNADSITWFQQQLQDKGTRYAAATNAFDVANWIKSQFIRFGYTNADLDPFVFSTMNQWDVFATIPGTLAPEKIIVIGGHHDSIVFDGNDPLLIAPGADDNASGTAAVLEIARVMKANNYQPECTIRFVTFACEELGLWGSKHYAQEMLDQSQNIKLMINHDMISNNNLSPDNWMVRILPYEGFEAYTAYAMNVAEANTTLTTYPGSLNSAGSDSYSFWQRGFPAIYFEEHQFSPYYHSINDLVANTDPQYIKEIVKASTAIAVTYDQNPSPVRNVYVYDTGAGNTLEASWNNANLEPDVVSYKVYVTTDLNLTPVVYTTAEQTFIIPNLVTGQQYFVGVAALDSDGNEGLAYFVAGTPQSLPQPPAGLVDEPQFHSVTLRWIASPELDVVGYRIYRSPDLDGTYNLISPLLYNSNTFEDIGIIDLVYYYYKVTAIDSDGNESAASDIVRSRALTMNQGILIVDETRNNIGNSVFAPNDADSDLFYNTVLHGFQTTEFDTETNPTLKLADIGVYSSLLWHGNDFGNLTYPFLVREEIKKYLQAGGKILITSYLPSQAFDNNFGFPRSYTAGEFMYDVFGVQNVNYDNRARFKYALPQDSGFPALTVDTLKTLAPLQGHIYTIESIGASAEAQNIYYYGSDYEDSASQGIMNGLPVGVYYNTTNGKSVLLSFPLYNMYQSDVTSLMQYVFGELFDETSATDDQAQNPVLGLSLSHIYPNPFEGSVQLQIGTNKSQQPISVSIYNIKGQKVKTLFTGIAKSGKQELNWDGKDEQSNPVSNSIYFIRAEQSGKQVSRKIIKLN